MRFKEFNAQNEVFDNAYKWDQESPDDYVFYDEKGSQFWVFIHDERISTTLLGTELQQVPEDIRSKWGTMIAFSKDGEFDMTSKSNAFRVFATIKEIFKDTKNKLKKADYVFFGSDNGDKGRLKFYDTVAQYVKKELNFKNVQKVKDQTETIYIISK